jgi:hypothetical protein
MRLCLDLLISHSLPLSSFEKSSDPVSALVFHHPDCAYFTAAEAAESIPVS